MGRGRPGGNPELKEHQYISHRPEPCTANLGLRLPPSDYDRLRKIPNYQDKVRDFIKKLIEENYKSEA